MIATTMAVTFAEVDPFFLAGRVCASGCSHAEHLSLHGRKLQHHNCQVLHGLQPALQILGNSEKCCARTTVRCVTLMWKETSRQTLRRTPANLSSRMGSTTSRRKDHTQCLHRLSVGALDSGQFDLGQWGLYSTLAQKKTHRDLFYLGQNLPLPSPPSRLPWWANTVRARVGARRVGGTKFCALFCLSRHTIFIFSFSWVSSR